MIERKMERNFEREVPSDGNFSISVAANGQIYNKIITRDQIIEAYGKALKKNSVSHGAEVQ